MRLEMDLRATRLRFLLCGRRIGGAAPLLILMWRRRLFRPCMATWCLRLICLVTVMVLCLNVLLSANIFGTVFGAPDFAASAHVGTKDILGGGAFMFACESPYGTCSGCRVVVAEVACGVESDLDCWVVKGASSVFMRSGSPSVCKDVGSAIYSGSARSDPDSLNESDWYCTMVKSKVDLYTPVAPCLLGGSGAKVSSCTFVVVMMYCVRPRLHGEYTNEAGRDVKR